MGHSSQLSDLLDRAVAKASQLSAPQQDRIARDIFATMAGEPEPPPGNGTLGALIDFIKWILPASDMARLITVVFCVFILLAQAPAALLSGILPIVRELKTRPCPAPMLTESQPQEAENESEERRKIEKLRQDLKQTRERAERSERKQQLVETYYSIFESGIFEERTAVDLARNPSGYSSIVSKINRAITAGPFEVSSELRNFLLILEKFAADRYAVRDLQDYYDVKVRVLKVMRQAIEADTNP